VAGKGSKVTITIDDSELRAKLKKMDAEVRGDIIEDAVDAGLDVILSAVDRYTPVKTGALKSRNKKQIWKKEPGYVEGEVLNDAPHAHLVEMGHGGLHPAGPHPFLRTGFDTAKAGAENAVTNVVTNRLEAI
jgi:HK97 gp10 family phage protein